MSSDEVVDNKAAEEGGEAKEAEDKSEDKAGEARSEEEAGDAPEVEAKVAGPSAKAAKAEEPSADKDEPAAEADEAASEDKADDAEDKAAPDEAREAHEGGDDHGELAMEDDRPKNGIIVTTIVVTAVAVVASVLGIREVYYSYFGAEAQEKIYGLTSAELKEVRAEEKAKLNRYQWVSKKDGVVRIPLDRAVALTLADYKEKAKQAAQAPKPVEAPKPDGSAAPDAPKPAGSAAPEAPKPEAPKEH